MEERVRLLQGSFEISSAKDKGTRINITLPSDKIRFKPSPLEFYSLGLNFMKNLGRNLLK